MTEAESNSSMMQALTGLSFCSVEGLVEASAASVAFLLGVEGVPAPTEPEPSSSSVVLLGMDLHIELDLDPSVLLDSRGDEGGATLALVRVMVRFT